MSVLPHTRGDLWCIVIATREVVQGAAVYVSAFQSLEGGKPSVCLRDSKFGYNGVSGKMVGSKPLAGKAYEGPRRQNLQFET